VQHIQREVYCIIVLVSFLLEREMLTEMLFKALSLVFDNFF